MAISSKRPDPATLCEGVTNIVRFWLDDEEDATPFGMVAGHCGQGGPCQAVLAAEDLDEAAEVLREWFFGHLVGDRRSGAHLDKLAGELVEAALGAVDWLDLADEIRD